MATPNPHTCPNKRHRWPRNAIAITHRSDGVVSLAQCNNCLAMHVVQKWWDEEGGEHERISVVEFKL